MSEERFRTYAAVYAILIKEEKVFLLRRFQTGWQDGKYGLPSGHIEEDETVTSAVIREVKEETGVSLRPASLKFAHVMYRMRKGERTYADFYFVASDWHGDPHLAENDKSDEVGWFALDALPENLIDSTRTALENYRKQIAFSEFGMDGRI